MSGTAPTRGKSRRLDTGMRSAIISAPRYPQPCGVRPPHPPRPTSFQTPRPVLIRPPVCESVAPQAKPVTRDVKNLVTSDDTTIPVGRGSIRGRRVPEMDNFEAPRPESSLAPTGKKGFSGTELKLLANYFPLTAIATNKGLTQWEVYQYRVDFDPEEDRIAVKRSLLAQHRQIFGGYLFDGTMLFTSSRLNPESFELTSQTRNDNKMVTIKVKFTNLLKSGDYAYMQIFNLLLRNCIRHLGLKLISRNFYDPEAKIDIPAHKLQLWPGYQTSIAKYENDSILMCAEISTKVMRQETVLDFFLHCAAERYKDPDWMNTFKNGVIGTTVMTAYNNESYIIDDIDETSDPSSTFPRKDGTIMSYYQYYKEKWNVQIRGGKQPMLVSKNKKKSVRLFGEEECLVYLVPELCVMTGLTTQMRNNFNLMKEMASYTRINPDERVRRLQNFVKRVLSSNNSVEEFKKWNLKLSNNLVEVTGRVLNFEPIYSNSKNYSGGEEADWTKHLRMLPMYMCAVVKCWVVVAPVQNIQEVNNFVKSLERAAKQMYFTLPQPVMVPLQDVRPDTIICSLEQVINQRNPLIILCVIPPRGQLYAVIKRKLCVDRAVPSQVVLLKNVQKNNLSVATKIAIQLNCKLGGAPWLVKIPKKGMMIVGYDVYHTQKGKKKISFGALIATMGDTHTNIFSCVEPHEVGEELSNHFAATISKALLTYKSINGCLPSCIVVFRDGVGEGQIQYVQKIEIRLFKAAIKEFYGDAGVPMTFVIVTKRISARFFTKHNIRNPPAGTVVDTVVTDPTKYDFYLVSQHSRQGTVSPTHYQIIEDTLNLPPDHMQKLTFKLCHMYFNWSGTIRVPAPCLLAHKLAYFAGQTLGGPPNTGLDRLPYFL
ncbi:piwi-like protein Siwi [Adelges cooleyi]|uniref:piwi-like protein Siwi n=1 Tax=Adelges cooleyi TaxID=133065 RepID=UPI0021803BA1|nr:piwi-like protein Siwi [Adelges cooleyi]